MSNETFSSMCDITTNAEGPVYVSATLLNYTVALKKYLYPNRFALNFNINNVTPREKKKL
jgi:hypothetical protein